MNAVRASRGRAARALALAAALALVAAPAAADERYSLVPFDPSREAAPATAAGALVWNHSAEPGRDTDPAPPAFVALFRGWDVYALKRSAAGDRRADATRALIAAAEGLRRDGYRALTLAGQSAGGWIAFAAAADRPGLVDAVIATAPAAFGRDPAGATRNAGELYALAARLPASTRVAAFFFAGDPFDPGGRGPRLADLLAQRGVPRLVVDEPPGLRGHGIGMTRAFARRYGACIVAFVERPAPNGLACEALPAAEVPWSFRLPDALPDDGPPPFGGRWRGSLDNGDDVLLAVGGDAARAEVVFARGASRPEADDRPFAVRRACRVEAEALACVESGQPRLEARPLAPMRLVLSWISADGRRRFAGALDRVE